MSNMVLRDASASKNTSKVVCATCRDDLVDEKVRRQTAIEKAKAMKCDDVS